MANFDIIVGTVLGASEYVADALQETLEKHGHSATIWLEPNLEDLSKQSTWLICTSTHGAGDLPDNIQPFEKQLKGQDLSEVNFLVVGLGDSSYDTYCNGAIQMQDSLEQANATMLHKPIHIDVLHHPIPEDAAVVWLEDLLQRQNENV
ncbi:FMN-binding protein MioC [Aliiglaciecola sp. LCG003]|uniref:FMN-binding protein MioC n=1 Tax=Aliiglaciecola sp. LCG003 TaxID=3053655 RepID=UPI002572682A|nr:FMN-binding protein MioC [Aliiglaciecola sp. LCG003]WJG09452.1 FMN-binding protein MioC [Aliiglaciecola sp. LCG003]